MTRWTTTHPFPPIQGNGSYRLHSIRIGKCIWSTIAENDQFFENREKHMERMHFTVFDSETKTYSKVECKYDGKIPRDIGLIGSHGDHIYMLGSRTTTESRNVPSRHPGKRRLLRLDTKTLVWEEFMRLHCGWKSLIIGDRIYFLDRSRITIVDLKTKKVAVHIVKSPPYYSSYGAQWDMAEINGDVYIIVHNDTHRNVAVVRNGQVIQLKNDEYKDKDVATYYSTNASGTVLYTQRTATGTFYLDTFDPERCKWNRQYIEKCWRCYDFQRVHSFWEIDGKIYTMMQSQPKEWSEYEIRVLDLMPDLSTLCCLNIVNTMENKKLSEAEQLTKDLPIDIRIRVDNMNEWREDERVPLTMLTLRMAYKKKRETAKQRSIDAKRRKEAMDEDAKEGSSA